MSMSRGRRSKRSGSSSSYRGKAPSRSRSYNLRSRSVRKPYTAPKKPSIVKPGLRMIKRAVSLDPRAFSDAWKTGYAIGRNIRALGYKRGGRGYSGGSQLGGKFKEPYKKIKKQKILGKWTAYGIQKQGITLRYESRKSVHGKEAVAIGHTSIPGQVSCIQFFRALIKHLLKNLGVHVKDFGNLMINEGFASTDKIRIYYYGPQPQSMSAANFEFQVTAATTYDNMVAVFAAHFDAGELRNIRLDTIVFVPSATSSLSSVNLQLNTLKISVTVHSKLSVQNVTVEDAQDDEADDINAVPLVGKIYKTRGNNIMQKSNRKTLPGLFTHYYDDALFESYDKQGGSFVGGTQNLFYDNTHGPVGNNDNTVFFRPAEPPRDMDIVNLLGSNSCSLQPGEIKHSVLFNTFEMSLQKYWDLLFGNRTNEVNQGDPVGTGYPYYNPELGVCNTLVLEKAIGRKPNAEVNDIKVWVQLQYHQSVLVHGRNSFYTLPIQFQTDYD